MRITFLYHSSFLVELESCTLLFDWYSGDFPEIDRSKPLYVFNSHHHGDHYSPEVFRLGMENTWYILGSCIRLSAKRKAAFAIDEDHVFRLGGGRALELGGLHIETLTSTDVAIGEAELVWNAARDRLNVSFPVTRLPEKNSKVNILVEGVQQFTYDDRKLVFHPLKQGEKGANFGVIVTGSRSLFAVDRASLGARWLELARALRMASCWLSVTVTVWPSG